MSDLDNNCKNELLVNADKLYNFEGTTLFIPATTDVDPNTLNLKSKGRWITCYPELPHCSDVDDINMSTITISQLDNMEVNIPSESAPIDIGDYDTDGIPDLMVKFDRAAVIAALDYLTGDVEFTITGMVASTPFVGSDVVRMIRKGMAKQSSRLLATGLPDQFALFQNHPNPFNPETVIRYQLPKAKHVSLIIFNSVGQKIRTLVDEVQKPGFYTVHWDGRDHFGNFVSSGVYFYTLRVGEFRETRKALLLR